MSVFSEHDHYQFKPNEKTRDGFENSGPNTFPRGGLPVSLPLLSKTLGHGMSQVIHIKLDGLTFGSWSAFAIQIADTLQTRITFHTRSIDACLSDGLALTRITTTTTNRIMWR